MTYGIGTPTQFLDFRIETGTLHTWVVGKDYQGESPQRYDFELVLILNLKTLMLS
jgi:hypothetical protein